MGGGVAVDSAPGLAETALELWTPTFLEPGTTQLQRLAADLGLGTCQGLTTRWAAPAWHQRDPRRALGAGEGPGQSPASVTITLRGIARRAPARV